MYCAHCGKEIKKGKYDRGNSYTGYYRYLDNFLQVKYFEELDGSDNVFCSRECADEALMLEYFQLDVEDALETGT
jgi:hypothetical protein